MPGVGERGEMRVLGPRSSESDTCLSRLRRKIIISAVPVHLGSDLQAAGSCQLRYEYEYLRACNDGGLVPDVTRSNLNRGNLNGPSLLRANNACSLRCQCVGRTVTCHRSRVTCQSLHHSSGRCCGVGDSDHPQPANEHHWQ